MDFEPYLLKVQMTKCSKVDCIRYRALRDHF